MIPKWKRRPPGSLEKVSRSAPGGSQEAPRGLLEARWKGTLENDGFQTRNQSYGKTFWSHFGSQNGAKMEQKSMQKSIKILMPFGIGFLTVFGGFLELKWSQVGTKIHKKSMPKCNPLSTPFLC